MSITSGVFNRGNLLTNLNKIETKTVGRGGDGKDKLSTNKSQQLGALLKEVKNSLGGLDQNTKEQAMASLSKYTYGSRVK